jgi:hypothetical protein
VSGVLVRVGSNVGDTTGIAGVALAEVGDGAGVDEVELAQDVNSRRQKSKAVKIALTRLTNIEYPS